jgi:hypothetical protein
MIIASFSQMSNKIALILIVKAERLGLEECHSSIRKYTKVF